MEERGSYKHLSGRARAALAGEVEGTVILVDGIEDVDASLLADVANLGGGTVLVGVTGGAGGVELVGCPVDDDARQAVRDEAEACVPPLGLRIVAENTVRTPLLRVEVEAAEGEDILVPDDAVRALLDDSGQLVREMGQLRAQVAGLADRLEAIQRSTVETATRLDRVDKTARDAVARVRALARHLGADDKLVAWERRQLRNLMVAAVEMAGKKARPAEADEVLGQVRKTWSKFTEWVSDEVVDPLQRDAEQLLRTREGEDEPLDPEDDLDPE